jgi:long-chain acyl-CoA synthetase
MLIGAPHLPVLHVSREARTLGDMLVRRARHSRTRVAACEKRSGVWGSATWGELEDASRRVAAGLLARGLRGGDRVAILGPTSTQWGIFDFGVQLAGMVGFGIYPKQTPEQIRYLLEHSRAKAVFVGDSDEVEKVVTAASGLAAVAVIAPWHRADHVEHHHRDPRVISPDVFEGEPLPRGRIDAIQQAIDPDDTAILVYTSGTTGPPKGAMITHRNILAVLGQDEQLFALYEDDLSFSFLPMAHVAERILGFYGRVDMGIAGAYASSIGAVLQEVREVRPTLFGSVPRIFEKAYAKIRSEAERRPAPVRTLLQWAERVARQAAPHRIAGRELPQDLRWRYAMADRLVFRKIRAAFGGRVRHFVVGAAPTAPDLLEFFWGAGLDLYEVYGMTEATVVTHANRPGQVRVGTVGRPLGITQQRLAADGELLLRGPMVFKGYLDDPEATAQVVADGWLHTGDVGEVDDEGYLRLVDRKKHLIITAGGKNLSPANIENAIKAQSPLVSQVHAHGDRRAYVSALLAPSPIETLELGVQLGLCTARELAERTKELMTDPSGRTRALEEAVGRVVGHTDFVERMRDAVRRANLTLANVEQVRRFVILDRDFSQEHGELTPTMKLKRKTIETARAPLFDRIYAEEGFALEP